MEKLAERIKIVNENILNMQLHENKYLFSNKKGLTFLLEITDKLVNIGGAGCCLPFENFEEVKLLFESLEIIDFEKKLQNICNENDIMTNKIYLAFYMKRHLYN